jgi:hypothetical protein
MGELEDLKQRAQGIGLDRLEPDHLRQLARAIAGMERLVERLPRDLPVAQEPAHVFRAKGDAP